MCWGGYLPEVNSPQKATTISAVAATPTDGRRREDSIFTAGLIQKIKAQLPRKKNAKKHATRKAGKCGGKQQHQPQKTKNLHGALRWKGGGGARWTHKKPRATVRKDTAKTTAGWVSLLRWCDREEKFRWGKIAISSPRTASINIHSRDRIDGCVAKTSFSLCMMAYALKCVHKAAPPRLRPTAQLTRRCIPTSSCDLMSFLQILEEKWGNHLQTEF